MTPLPEPTVVRRGGCQAHHHPESKALDSGSRYTASEPNGWGRMQRNPDSQEAGGMDAWSVPLRVVKPARHWSQIPREEKFNDQGAHTHLCVRV